MKPGLTVTKDDTAKVLASIRAMTRQHVVVGIPAAKNQRQADGTYSEPIGNAGLGYIHENGSEKAHIPPRPWLVPGMRFAIPKLLPVLRAAARDGLGDKEAVPKGLTRAGLVAASTVKQYLKSLALNGAHRLAESTLAARRRRGVTRENPLIDTGQLLNGVNFEVRGK